MAHSKQITSAVDLFSKSYRLVLKNLPMFLLLSSVSIVSAVLTAGQSITDDKTDKVGWGNIASSALGPDLNTRGLGSLGILVAVFTVVGIVFMVMILILSLRAAQGKIPNFDDLWRELRDKGLKLLLLVICLGLFVLASAIPAALLFIIFAPLVVLGAALVVFVVWRLSMAPYLMIDKQTDISESIIQSWEMTKGYAWPIISIYLVSMVLAVTNLIPIAGAIIALALSIIYTCAMPLRYEEIKHTHHPKTKTQDS